MREVTPADLESVDAVVHLAALSNDPLGEFDESLTYAINYEASVRLARLARSCRCRALRVRIVVQHVRSVRAATLRSTRPPRSRR